ncbi:helix-turn-helix domain-containing protein [Streptomyces sp. NPDC020571]|uniref:helix-turn-helix domain-containing protein n=1 Tax=unclassified Streptomyces TaxID=2593676 RepID=UPI0037B8CF74
MHALPQTTLACGWRLRLERHLTQQALADLSGVPYNTPTRIEQGRLAATPHAVVILVRAMRVEFSTNVGQPYKDELRADELDALGRRWRSATWAPTPTSRRVHSGLLRELREAVRGRPRRRDQGSGQRCRWPDRETTTAAHTHGSSDGMADPRFPLPNVVRRGHQAGYADPPQLSLVRMEWTAQRASDAVSGGAYHYLPGLEVPAGGEVPDRTAPSSIWGCGRTARQTLHGSEMS